jgi:hypothetical protein
MNKLPDENEQLRRFLQEYRPLPPEASPNLEQKLLTGLNSRKKNNNYRWILIAIASSCLATWVGYHNFKPALNYSAVDREELETFLIDSWDETLEMEVSSIDW